MIKARSVTTPEYSAALEKYCSRYKLRLLYDILIRKIAVPAVWIYIIYFYIFYLRLYDLWTLFICFGLILLIWYNIRDIRKKRRRHLDVPCFTFCAVFTEDTLIFDSEREIDGSPLKNTLHYEINYSRLYSAKECGGFFFIETEPGRYVIIRHSDITEGSPMHLRRLLMENLNEKFTPAG